MKNCSRTISSLLLLSLFAAEHAIAYRQDADPNLSAKQLATSLEAWQKAKAKSEGNYTYTVSKSSFSGARWVTTIVVRSNKVASRKFEVFNERLRPVAPGEEPGKQDQKPKWVETGNDIGKHKEGAPPRTVDELYAEAKKVVKAKLQPHDRLYIGFQKNGLLRHCFYVDTRIADDAPTTGVRISTLKMEAEDSPISALKIRAGLLAKNDIDRVMKQLPPLKKHPDFDIEGYVRIKQDRYVKFLSAGNKIEPMAADDMKVDADCAVLVCKDVKPSGRYGFDPAYFLHFNGTWRVMPEITSFDDSYLDLTKAQRARFEKLKKWYELREMKLYEQKQAAN